MKFKLDKQSVNWRSFLLGGVLNILVVIVAIMLYNVYVVQPKIEEVQSGKPVQEFRNSSSSSSSSSSLSVPMHSSSSSETPTQKSINK